MTPRQILLLSDYVEHSYTGVYRPRFREAPHSTSESAFFFFFLVPEKEKKKGRFASFYTQTQTQTPAADE